jgi:5-formyltetrahydrofolate cyclo-ligase
MTADKADIRERMRALRAALPEAERAARSEKIVQSVAASASFVRVERVALFWPMLDRQEVDLRQLDAIARSRGKRVLYPRIAGPSELSLCYARPDELALRGHGFHEPPEQAEQGAAGADLLIVVPALAVSLDGKRIGYGKGFYDRLLARAAPPACTMVVAFDLQIVAELPATADDRPVDWIVTEARVCAARAQ